MISCVLRAFHAERLDQATPSAEPMGIDAAKLPVETVSLISNRPCGRVRCVIPKGGGRGGEVPRKGALYTRGREGRYERRWNKQARRRGQDGRGARGSLESFYFAFGETDGYVVLDLPDNRAAAAASMAVNAAGAASSEVVVLLTPEDIDAAAKISVDYQSPGS